MQREPKHEDGEEVAKAICNTLLYSRVSAFSGVPQS